MIHRVEFAPDDELSPGTWAIGQGERKPLVACPVCECYNLGDEAPHRIESNGDVNASVICWNCGFHAFIKLVGWEGGSVE